MVGYLIGLLGGLQLIEVASSHTHDKSMEAAIAGAFVFGPLMAVVAVDMLLVWRSCRVQSHQW